MNQADSGTDDTDSVEGYNLMDGTWIVARKTKGKRRMEIKQLVSKVTQPPMEAAGE